MRHPRVVTSLLLLSLVSASALAGCGELHERGDAAPREAGLWDAGRWDAGRWDAGAARVDASVVDPGLDAGPDEPGARDAGRPDAGAPSASDAGPVDSGPLPYPTRTAFRIKGLQPDFHANVDEVIGNNTGGIAVNLVWALWEPSVRSPPCAASQEEYDGHCFDVPAATDSAIAEYSARGVVITGVVYGVPEWARAGRPCSPVAAGFEWFCVPNDARDYGRFAGMLARRYDGRHGHGRVADFVIHNEVNSNDWFDIGCGQGTPCDVSAWVRAYADSYNAAYDRIVLEQATAKVLVSLEHHFGASFDAPSATNALLSGETFLRRFAPLAAPRAWRVAYHPYPPNLLRPEFSPDDWPRVTYGNIGTLVGWLRNTFRDVPSAWEVQLTESGVNSLSPSSQAAQADGVCRSFRNVLGTPGIESYIYHRMHDHPVETAAGLGVGLFDESGRPKAAWSVWALANRDDLSPAMLSCGFEDLPHVRLTRSFAASRGHWASTRLAPPGFTTEASWRLLRDPAPGTTLLYECRVGSHNLLTPAVDCEGQHPMGPVGYIHDAPGDGRVALHRCYVPASGDHFVSPSASCEGQTHERLLGYAVP